MNIGSVRIVSTTISNFKNVINGSLSFENMRKEYKASVLGLYGQNGSGKTALIDALELLKYALCGKTIPHKFADFINVNSEASTLIFEFVVKIGKEHTTVSYQFSIKSVLDHSERNVDSMQASESQKRVVIFNELLKCPIWGEKKSRIGKLIDTSSSELFIPKPKKQLLVGSNKEIDTNLKVVKRLASAQSRSFVFSRELLESFKINLNQPEEFKKERLFYVSLIESLVNFGNRELFIINPTNSNSLSLNALSLDKLSVSESITIPLNSPVLIPIKTKGVVLKIVETVNIVLKQIVLDLTIRLRELGNQILQNGEEGCKIQLMSLKDGKEIPFKYESEGIKKIVSILQLLIVVYNRSSITVAIDELDSGVFEYLLGELLEIISERGKGQLIFTSHNLRPLETLDRGFIAFTTTNPQKRYVRMVNVKENNNLRDFYFRDIMLGEQDEELYEYTNNSEIAFAFREALEVFNK